MTSRWLIPLEHRHVSPTPLNTCMYYADVDQSGRRRRRDHRPASTHRPYHIVFAFILKSNSLAPTTINTTSNASAPNAFRFVGRARTRPKLTPNRSTLRRMPHARTRLLDLMLLFFCVGACVRMCQSVLFVVCVHISANPYY